VAVFCFHILGCGRCQGICSVVYVLLRGKETGTRHRTVYGNRNRYITLGEIPLELALENGTENSWQLAVSRIRRVLMIRIVWV
jgi:hypothetical protein